MADIKTLQEAIAKAAERVQESGTQTKESFERVDSARENLREAAEAS